MNNNPIISIDLGNYNCRIGIFIKGKFEIIPNDLGEKETPAYVAFTDKEILVGTNAKNQIHRNPKNTIFCINRLIGRKFEEKEVQEQMKFCPFKIIKDHKSLRLKIQVTYKGMVEQYFPENILSIILKK